MPSVYDHPEYYDILFGWDRDAEAAAYADVLARYGVRTGDEVLEIAAGTAQVGIRLARRGFAVTALDSSPSMLAFATTAAGRDGVALRSLVASMESFRAPGRFAAAVNPMSSFRLLLADEAVDAHLECVAAALRPDGVYLVDLTFGTDGSAESDIDEWTMVRAGVVVAATARGIEVLDPARPEPLTLDWHGSLRAYPPGAFERLLERHDDLTIAGCYRELAADGDISRFSSTAERDLPAAGRAIVALRRRVSAARVG